MSYADITFRHKKPLVRWLQEKRLVTAIKLAQQTAGNLKSICDYGAGNGELCKHLSEQFANATITCFEPTPELMQQAKINLAENSAVNFCDNTSTLTPETLDIIFCLEVFEHLPPEETIVAINRIFELLKPGGILIAGVPVEIRLPALYKGLYRMLKRYGEFDANPKNIATSLLGKPPVNRPVSEIAPGINYHFQHMGFDFRELKRVISPPFKLLKTSASPFAVLGSWVMPEMYLVLQK